MITTQQLKCILLILLFSKVLQIDSCSSFPSTISRRHPMERRKLSCESVFGKDWCMNGGACYLRYRRNQPHYLCVCTNGFIGDRCETQIVDKQELSEDLQYLSSKIPCDEPYRSNFCLNDGICYQLMFHNVPEYRCECSKDFYGHKCEEKTLEGFYGNGLKSTTASG